jgi:hypothetical protein
MTPGTSMRCGVRRSAFVQSLRGGTPRDQFHGARRRGNPTVQSEMTYATDWSEMQEIKFDSEKGN